MKRRSGATLGALAASTALVACDATPPAPPPEASAAGRERIVHRIVVDPSAVGPRGPRARDRLPEADGAPNTIETLVSDMRLPSDTAWAHPGYSGADGAPLNWQSRVQVPDIGTLAVLDELARKNGVASDFYDRVDSIAPGFIVAEGVGNRSRNTQVLVRRLSVHVMYDDGRWLALPAPARPSGHISRIDQGQWRYSVEDELPSKSLVRQRRIDATITATRPEAPYFSDCGFTARIPEPKRVIAFWVAAQARLTTIDPAGVDDLDEAVYVANAWWDLYDADGQARRMPRRLDNGAPGHAIDGAVGRLKKIGRDWQWFNVLSLDGTEPPLLSAPWAYPEWKTVSPAKSRTLTEARLRAHPPPLR